MTQAEIEAQLAALRDEVDQLRERETNRIKAWKLSLTVIRIAVVVIALSAVGLIVHDWMTGQNPLHAVQLLLLNIPLIFLANALQAGAEPPVAKG